MNIKQILNRIHIKYAQDTDYPSSSSDDYLVRLELINDAIDEWQNEESVTWMELFATLTDTVTGSTHTLPTGFRFAANYLRVGSSEDKYSFVRTENVAEALACDANAKIFWITGGEGVRVLNVNPVLSGETVKIDYYKAATKYTDGTETAEPEMTDQSFIVDRVVAELHLNDENDTQASISLQSAQQKLSGMRMKDTLTPHGAGESAFGGFAQNSGISNDIAFGA